MNRFNFLLQRYLSDQATEEERFELMELINRHGYQQEGEKILEQNFGKHQKDVENAQEKIQYILSIAKEKERIIPIRRHSSIKRWWLAAAAVLAFVISSTYVVLKKTDERNITKNDQINEYKFHGKRYVVFPDGSTATMNTGSELTYNDTYGEHLREVNLKGEAYFTVKPDRLHAFVVRVGSVQTHVLGTEFNVNASNKKDVVVTVSKGKVQVLNNMKELGVITPDQQISINTETHEFSTANVKAESFIAWKSKFLIIDNISLENATKLIGERYDVEVILSEEIKNCNVRFAFLRDENLTEVLNVICDLTNATCTKKDKRVIITGKGCAN